MKHVGPKIEAKGQNQEWGGEGQKLPSPPAIGPGERCEGVPTAQRFSTIFSTQNGLS